MIALLKLSPIAVLAGMMIGGIDILLSAPVAFVCAVLVAMATEHYTFGELQDAALDNLRHFLIVFLILQAAYAVAECFMSTGVAAAIINMALSMGMTAKLVAPACLVVTAILSVATGTSWGTFAACAPIFLWLNHIVGGSTVLVVAAAVGGSCFGDNIGLISDTTVVSSGMQNVSVIDRVRHQGVWSALCLALGVAAFYLASVSMGLSDVAGSAEEAIRQIPDTVWAALEEKRPAAVTLLHQVQAGVPYYMVIPLVLVLIMAARGTSTLICLGTGILSSLVFGFAAGTVTSLSAFGERVYAGFSDAGGWSIAMMLWVGAFGGVMRKMNAFDPIAAAVLRCVSKVRQLMFANAALCLLGNAALADEMAQIVTLSPIIRNLTEQNVEGDPKAMYRLALRNATFADAMAVLGAELIPWHAYMAFFAGITWAVYPLAVGTVSLGGIILHNYFAWIAVGSMLILTWTGWDRFIPLFSIPTEPEVRLRRAADPKPEEKVEK